MKATSSINVPMQRRNEFLAYIGNEAHRSGLSWVFVENRGNVRLTVQKVADATPGVVNVIFENTSSHASFLMRVETCNAQEDWQELWMREKQLAEAFAANIEASL